MSHVDARVSPAVMRDRVNKLIEQPPKPVRALWGLTQQAQRGAAAAIASTSGPARELTPEQRAERARRRAELLRRRKL